MSGRRSLGPNRRGNYSICSIKIKFSIENGTRETHSRKRFKGVPIQAVDSRKGALNLDMKYHDRFEKLIVEEANRSVPKEAPSFRYEIVEFQPLTISTEALAFYISGMLDVQYDGNH